MKYLLDTNIWIYLEDGDEKIASKIREVLPGNCFMSEITVAELKYGAECSNRKEENMEKVDSLVAKFEVIPISAAIDVYALEFSALKRIGKQIEKFDALIAATAVVHKLTLVTNDSDFIRFKKLKLENWASHITKNFLQPTPVSKL